MNCINCGAPPRAGRTECQYCETALGHLVEEADHDGFKRIHDTLACTDSDMRKVDIVALCRGPFTAGQVREILALFTSDMRRVEAAAFLIRRTTNPSGLLACADLFYSDMRRTDFVTLLPRSATMTSGRPSTPIRAQRPPTTTSTAWPTWLVLLVAAFMGGLLFRSLW